jgi:nitroimidazol reductase NimA-like FMN-containing flavoprotein (pyridoxamine 5'-phosphate oxidase superfamily)
MTGFLCNQHIEQFLHSQAVGRIGCSCEGLPYVVPVTYAYDGKRVIAHSAEGMKIQMMRSSPKVCFEVDQIDDLANWRSVIAWGCFRELQGNDAALAMGLLLERFRPMTVSETAHPHHHALQHDGPFRGVVFEIVLREKTGRYEKH